MNRQDRYRGNDQQNQNQRGSRDPRYRNFGQQQMSGREHDSSEDHELWDDEGTSEFHSGERHDMQGGSGRFNQGRQNVQGGFGGQRNSGGERYGGVGSMNQSGMMQGGGFGGQSLDNGRFQSSGFGGRSRRNTLNRGPKGYVRSDDRIKEEISDELTDHEFIDASEVEITVANGEVTLSGIVSERYIKHAIEDLADDVRGVKDVINNIKVKRQDVGVSSTSDKSKQGGRDDDQRKNRSTVSPS